MYTQLSLFDFNKNEELCVADAIMLRGFANSYVESFLDVLHTVIQVAPYRHMVTPGGYRMSVAMTSCGSFGWVTDHKGYRYVSNDPESGLPWPPMPEIFSTFATLAADRAGFAGFKPNSCLINCYEPGAKLSLHQDKDEKDLTAPVVSVSLGLPAVFLFGGLSRGDSITKVLLVHGDVIVWGGRSRLAYHVIMPIRKGVHPLLGQKRINLTFRRAKVNTVI